MSFDVYRGRIAIKGHSGRWRWGFLSPGYESLAKADEPNQHIKVRRTDGQPVVHIGIPYLTRGALLTDEELRTIDTIKYGIVEEAC